MDIAVEEFWCWSRKDYDENFLQNISISTVFRDEKISFESISTSFISNRTHVKCDSNVSWFQEWVYIGNPFMNNAELPCVTNSTYIPVATFTWEQRYYL